MQLISQDNLNIDDIVRALKDGQTFVYPTETCYGLGCDATNDEAVKKVYAIKQRQEGKSPLVIMSDIGMVKRYVVWTKKLDELASKYWPGPLTIVAPLIGTHGLSPDVIRDNTIAFRVSGHPIVSEICARLDRPIVSTSANLAAQNSPYDIGAVLDMFATEPHRPDIVIDGGELPHRSPSTIVKVIGDHVEVLRQGDIIVT